MRLSGTLGRPSGNRSNGFCAVHSIICSRVRLNSCAWPMMGSSVTATTAAIVNLEGPVIFVAPSVQLPLRYRRLQHCARVADVERISRIASAARILRPEVRPLPVVIDAARMLGVDEPRVLLLHQLLHHREHIVLP